MKRQPAPAKAKLTIFHRLGGFRKITVFQHRNRECPNFPQEQPGRNKLAMRGVADMNDHPNPFLPVIYSSTSLLLVAFGFAIILVR
jgi:hypothetical protein